MERVRIIATKDNYNPILPQGEWVSGLFPVWPTVEPGIAYVLRGDRETIVIEEDGLPFQPPRRWSRFDLYKVDKSEHNISFSCDLPSGQTGLDFVAEVHLTCSVMNALNIVKRHITDVRGTVEALLKQPMYDISVRYDVRQAVQAALALTEQVNQVCRSGQEPDLKLERASVRLTLSERARVYVYPKVTSEGEIIRVRGEQSVAEEKIRLDLKTKELEQVGNKEIELQILQKQHEIEKWNMDIMDLKVTRYHNQLQKGQLTTLAFLLSKCPEDVGIVVDLMRQMRREEFDRQFGILKALVDANKLPDKEVKDIVVRLLSECSGTSYDDSATVRELDGQHAQKAIEVGSIESGTEGRPKADEHAKEQDLFSGRDPRLD
jgi:hypothetical protein